MEEIMKWVLWIVSGLLAFGCGVFLLAYLVVDPLRIGLVVLAGIVLVGLWVLTAVSTFKGWQVLWGSLLAIACLVGGYLAATSVYLAQEEHRDLAAITRSESDPGDGHTAVLYFTHGEPPAYSPMPWIETFHELDGDGVSFIPWPFRPVFLNNLRREYLVVGGSAHNKVHQIMLQSLVQSLPEAKEQGVRFYQAFLDNAPRPDEMAIQAINDGASKLVILPVFLTDSSHTQAGQEMIDAVGYERYGIEACYARPLWDAEALQQMFVERANENLGDVTKDQVGIVLVGHGQPNDWDAIYPTQTEQENSFRTQVRQRLTEAGYPADQISMGWMEFKEPDIQQAVSELVAKGVKRLLIFSASISADSIHSDIQVPEAVAAVDMPEDVEVINLGAWGNSPLVIEAIRQRVLECEPGLAGQE
jgi:sirohydrochlorin ferrochelatase